MADKKGIEAVDIASTKLEEKVDVFYKELPDEISKGIFKQRWPLLIKSIESAANHCDFDLMAHLLRENGEDTVALSGYLEDLEERKIISPDKHEIVGDKWLELDEAVNNLVLEYLTHWCQCKLK